MFAVYRAMWQGIRPQGFLFFAAIFAFILGNAASILIPLQYKQFFDTITESAQSESVVPVLISIILMVAAINAFRWCMIRFGTFSIISIEAKGMARLRQRAFDYLIHHSHSFFANSFAGSLVQRVSRFARSLERLVDTISFNLIPLSVTTIGALIVTWQTERILALVILIWVAIFVLLNFVFSLWRVKYNVLVSEADSKTTGTLADIIGNQSAVSLFAAHRGEKERFKGVTERQSDILKFTWDITQVFDAVQAVLIFVAEFFVFYFAIQLWSQGAITVGTFVLVQAYIISLAMQLWDFGRIIRALYEIYADSKEMVEIMTLPHEIQDAPSAVPLIVSAGNVEFDHVSFRFGAGRSVLDDVTLSIPGGQKVALVGPSGAGKTTFVKLLLRFHDVTGGSVQIDGQDIRNVTLESLHRSIGMVPQDTSLFHRTLMENIRYGRLDATDDDVIRAAELAHCDEFIEHLPLKYQTFVGERGIKLSGGERQRIAIARAILKNAPILFLDEATSSLDSRSESLIQDALNTLMKGKTAIVIAHRLSTVKKMDRIIVIEGGKVAEDGTHDELMSIEGSVYRLMWELQAGGFGEEDEVEESVFEEDAADDEKR